MKLLREPLVHFVVLGALLFAAYRVLGKPTASETREILVTQGQVESLAAGFTRFHRRPPSPEELAGLVRDSVKDEVLSREARALGLDRDDAVIRQRLRQKMEFLSDGVAALAGPSEAQLAAYLAAHPEDFRIPATFTFEHVFLDPQKHSSRLTSDAQLMLERLRKAGTARPGDSAGDPFLLELRFEGASADDVARLFGEKFDAALAALPPGQWEGPIPSGYGVHLVRIEQRTEGRLPRLDEVRAAVRREWENSERKRAGDAFYAGLLKRYTITIENPRPEAAAGKQALTTAP